MTKQLSIVALGVVALLGCGGGAQVRAYKGTQTTIISSGGGSTTITATNSVFTVMPGNMPNEWLFIDNNTSYSATLNDNTLTIASGQGYAESDNSTQMNSYNVMVSSGTGTLSADQLTLNVQGTITQSQSGVTPQMATYTLTFSGTRE